ncbi:MAG: RNA polymerase sigma factor [Planctomycetota bacterium]|jgi:RNA polymerase sigma factor (sigma-70 family)
MGEVNPACDPERVQQIFEKNGVFIYSVIRFHLANSPDADDVFQSFFLRLLEKPIPKREVINERTYLYRMTKNSIIDDVRRTRAYKNRISRYSQILSYHKFVYDPCEKTIQEDEVKFIMHIIDNCLPTHIAATLRLRYKKKYSDDQITQATSVKRKTVIRYINTGLKRLRRILKKKNQF